MPSRTIARLVGPILVLCIASISTLQAANAPLRQIIDREIAKGLPNFASKAAPLASDAEFLRRIYLDLTGRIPSTQQARDFLADRSPNKRERLVDRLLASPEYARHMTYVFDELWMERRPDKHVKTAQWREYLRKSFMENKPYDQLVREVLSADGSDPKTRAAAKFYLDRLGEPHLITRDVSRLFLGMNLQCAQCHDHPLVRSYKQDFYYGVYAFFNRGHLFNDRKKKLTVYAEKGEGEVSYSSVFKPKLTKKTGPRLPGMPPVKEPSFKKGEEYKVKPSKNVRGIPKFSRRAQLPKLLANPANERFKRAAVNRFWYLMLGRGLVHPVDFDHPDNPPSHPELLTILAEEFAAGGFNIKALLKEIAMSDTYQRASQMPPGKELPPEKSFAVAQLRPLSPEQMAWSVLQATGQIAIAERALGKKATEDAVHKRLAGNVAPFVKIFGGQPGDPADLGFQATLDQTLFLRNGPQLRSWLAPRTGSLTHRLLQAKTDKALAEELFLSVLSRFPSQEEIDDVARFLKENGADRSAAVQELAWALIASAEFRFNH